MAAIADLPAFQPHASCVERVATLAPDVFLARYYAANEPVVWEGFLRHAPATRHWSPRYFAERFGHVTVEVMTRLQQPPHALPERAWQRCTMRLWTLGERIERHPQAGDVYLVAQNRALQHPDLAALWQDLSLDPGVFNVHDRTEKVSLWLGPGNTVTLLHYDLKPILLAQVYGRKRVQLISPLYTSRVYNRHGGYSQVDPEQPDFVRFPLFAQVVVSTVVLDAGDALFLPLGWWHHVRALSPSISLSLSNFVWPHTFTVPER